MFIYTTLKQTFNCLLRKCDVHRLIRNESTVQKKKKAYLRCGPQFPEGTGNSAYGTG